MNITQLAAFSTRAAATGAALWPAIVLIAGVQYPATVTEPKLAHGLITGGEQIEGILTARILLTDLPAAPALQQALQWKRPTATTWHPVTWWIEECKKSPLDVEWQVTCAVKN